MIVFGFGSDQSCAFALSFGNVIIRVSAFKEARLYEITKLRRQFREILEQNELVPKREEREWAELSSRDRRMLVGEKRKLYDLKRKAGYEGKRTKVLREGQHFDTIMERTREDGA